jgi:hypothetical protein
MKKYLLLSLFSLSIGNILFLYFNEIIIINFPRLIIKKDNTIVAYKKNIKIFFWKNDKWNRESIDILWSENNSEQNIYQIINNWLLILDEEKILSKRVSLQSALINDSTLYISFDNTLFSQESSTYNKLIILESILKTLKESNLTVNYIYFLVHNEIMEDHHLDFSNAWPISGFLN